MNFIFFIVFLELILTILIILLKKKSQWILTSIDEYPKFEKKKINQFLKKTYNKDLGWDWKPNSQYFEKKKDKKIKICFGTNGERLPNNRRKKYKFATFGDSFVFCRFVKNDETWQNQISDKFTGYNFGVGNFGLDQIYLKYKKTKLPKKIKNIFIGFVPETLSRCLCSWKHYHEFGNIYAFKPKYILKKEKLFLIKNPIINKNSFANIKLIIDEIKNREYFYKYKFKKRKLSFPLIITIFENFSFKYKLIFFSIIKFLKPESEKLIKFIISDNCKNNDKLFKIKNNFNILTKIFEKFDALSKKRKQKIIFLVFPQKHDLNLKEKNYKKYFEEMKAKYNIIDFTNKFKNFSTDTLYQSDLFGGHLTKRGNNFIAQEVRNRLLK